ncbi:MAG: hypothetical protein K0R47_316 [Brevibacillus sp.]|nr:hypothetical protein [Brevibacillus sp.]
MLQQAARPIQAPQLDRLTAPAHRLIPALRVTAAAQTASLTQALRARQEQLAQRTAVLLTSLVRPIQPSSSVG